MSTTSRRTASEYSPTIMAMTDAATGINVLFGPLHSGSSQSVLEMMLGETGHDRD